MIQRLWLSEDSISEQEAGGRGGREQEGYMLCIYHIYTYSRAHTKQKILLQREENELVNEKDEREGKPVARQLAPMISKFIRVGVRGNGKRE